MALAIQENFSNELFHAITADEHDIERNLIISPVSVIICLALACLGAKESTATEILQALQYTSLDKLALAKAMREFLDKVKSNGLPVKIVNRIYVDGKFQLKQQFNELSTEYFNTEAEVVDFAKNVDSAKKINSWIEQQTEGKIQEMMLPDSLNEATAAVLVNAIYLKANWLKPFEDSATTKGVFHSSGGKKTEVDMMDQEENFLYGKLQELNATALEMPYEDADLAMLVILPNEVNGLSKLQASLRSFNLTKLTGERLSNHRVHVKMPKFKIEYDISLQPVLEKLGMKTMFTAAANFDDLLESSVGLSVSEVKHKAFIEVDERGTTAAAATTLIFGIESMMAYFDICDFIVDRPFIFAIKDSSTVYFMGSVKQL